MGLPAEVLVECEPNKPSYRNGEIPLFTKLKARNLYLHESLPHKAISAVTGLPVKTLEQLAHREGWTAIKKANKERLTKLADERANALQPQIADALAEMSEEHAMRALQKTGEALERNDRDAAKDSQAFSATAKNLVSIAKAMREPNSKIEGDGGSIALNIFFSPPVAKAEKQVTEIEGKAVQ